MADLMSARRKKMFSPKFTITPKLASALVKLEALRHEIDRLPITPAVLAGLRETARLQSVHYSTKIEGNRLTEKEVADVIHKAIPIKGRERDQQEVLGYYAALDKVEHWAQENKIISQKTIQELHALVMSGGKKQIKPTPYRDAQNVIRDGRTHAIVYLPPEAKDVEPLMADLVQWLMDTESQLPCPLRASIAHYQFVTIHPYYDGNGRTARLLTTLILHKCGYDLRGFYSLEDYYAKDLATYYQALTVGPSHNYYEGRAKADITAWIEYFCQGMVTSFESVHRRALQAQERHEKDSSPLLKKLDPRQRAVLDLFQKHETVTTHDIAQLLTLKPRTARDLCQQWVTSGFLVVANASKKGRTYRLASEIERAVQA